LFENARADDYFILNSDWVDGDSGNDFNSADGQDLDYYEDYFYLSKNCVGTGNSNHPCGIADNQDEEIRFYALFYADYADGDFSATANDACAEEDRSGANCKIDHIYGDSSKDIGMKVYRSTYMDCNPSEPCCNFNGNYASSSSVCATLQTEFSCSGNDVIRTMQRQHCSGNSGSCNGNVVWTGWSVYDDCTSDEYCTVGDSSCNDCGTNEERRCYADDVWWYDLCNHRESIAQECGDSDLGEWSEPYCHNGDVWNSKVEISRGCLNANCFENSEEVFEQVDDCLGLGCVDGECIPPECLDDSQCAEYEYCEDYSCVEHFPTNVSVFLGDEFIFSHSGELDQEPVSVDSFSDILNGFVQNCNDEGLLECFIPLTFTSDTKGRLTLANIDISYRFVECFNDYDCGEDYFIPHQFQCEDNHVFQGYVNYTCVNPGSLFSNCVTEEIAVYNSTCDDICVDGECHDVECFNNLDCGTDFTIQDSQECVDNDVFELTFNHVCNNPGQINSYCSNSTTLDLSESCDDICVDGECYDVECSTNSDCGVDYFVQNTQSCFEDNVYMTFIQNSCVNPGTLNSSCVVNNLSELYEQCDAFCEDGSCYDPVCYEDSDCGQNQYLDDYHCNSEDVFDYYLSFECHSAGQASAYCSNVTQPVFVENCTYFCNAGQCGTPACFNDLDCGVDSYNHNLFCDGLNVFDIFNDYTCFNPGLEESYCAVDDVPNLIEECDEYCLNGECFLNQDLELLNIDFPSKVGIYSYANLTFTVRNNGIHSFRHVDFKIKSDEDLGTSFTPDVFYFQIRAGETINVTQRLRSRKEGYHKLQVSLDPFNQIEEFNEKNNVKTIRFKTTFYDSFNVNTLIRK
jgi:hypothetical protein